VFINFRDERSKESLSDTPKLKFFLLTAALSLTVLRFRGKEILYGNKKRAFGV